MLYIIQDREAGNVIERYQTEEEAEKALRDFEKEDKEDGTFEADFYEIVIKEQ